MGQRGGRGNVFNPCAIQLTYLKNGLPAEYQRNVLPKGDDPRRNAAEKRYREARRYTVSISALHLPVKAWLMQLIDVILTIRLFFCPPSPSMM